MDRDGEDRQSNGKSWFRLCRFGVRVAVAPDVGVSAAPISSTTTM